MTLTERLVNYTVREWFFWAFHHTNNEKKEPMDPRYEILFSPMKIGPVTAKNRFYQVPHCNGMGHRWPQAMAEMRAMKAEGGWGVVCTEECEIHPTSDLSGLALMRIWDESDLPVHELMVRKVKEHGALAGIQLNHNGSSVANYMSRLPPIAPSSIPTEAQRAVQARALSKDDIKTVRGWYRDAALRAKQAGYDIIYVYAAHGEMTLPFQFMSPRFNRRNDEYGGSLENRVRFTRELLEDIKDAVGDQCAVALRFNVDEKMGSEGMRADGEGRDVVELLADLPDLWDVNIADWSNDSLPSRFGSEGSQEDYIKFVKQVTDKPVVGVGRFTSPDTMVSQIRRGVLDLIGAARPSIADPFLPRKIQEGREDEIRECIGCNMCTSSDSLAYPMRCTQNPTMGEEWRKGWHPEIIPPAASQDKVLVVGGGPAGLECALALSNRNYDVVLSDGREALGGRVLQESRLPALSEWKRVIDYRTHLLASRANVETYVSSPLSASDVLSFGIPRIVIATGANWRLDGIGRENWSPIPTSAEASIIAPEEILNGTRATGRILVYDEEQYYLASALAQKLCEDGCEVTFVTPAANVSPWSEHTLEQFKIQQTLLTSGANVKCNKVLTSIGDGKAELECVYLGTKTIVGFDALVPVTSRISNDELHAELLGSSEKFADLGIKSVEKIGDCNAPGTIALAVYAGHQYARQLDEPDDQIDSFKRENYFGNSQVAG
jgi:dimethylamine/trimethylamine dehydrogenase